MHLSFIFNSNLTKKFLSFSAPVEPRNQGPPTYANLVKSGPTLIPNQGSLPSSGFGKQSAISPAPSAPSAAAGVAQLSQAAGNGGRDNKEAGFAGQGQQQGSGKFRNNRPSMIRHCADVKIQIILLLTFKI